MSESIGQERPLPDFEGDPFIARMMAPAASDMEDSGIPDPEPTSDEVDEFPSEVEDDFTGLMFLGALSSTFELFGHRFAIKTLRANEELVCAQLVKEYEGTLAQGKAYVIAQIAASIVTVDGREITKPLGPEDNMATLHRKFEYVRTHWYWPVIEMIYSEFANLMMRQSAAFDAYLGKSVASRMQLMPLPVSQSAKGF